MSESDWAQFEALVARYAAMAPTQARATGWCLRAAHAVPAEPEPGPLDWMDWERRKTLRLLVPKGPDGSVRTSPRRVRTAATRQARIATGLPLIRIEGAIRHGFPNI